MLPIKWRTGFQYIHDPLLVAVGLLSPGGGVTTVAWLALNDGRVPGRDAPVWTLAYGRATYVVAHALPSILVSFIDLGTLWTLPARTVTYAGIFLVLNYLITGVLVARLDSVPLTRTIGEHLGFRTVVFTAVLDIAGGIVFLLLQAPVGYLMAPVLFGFMLAVRSNVVDAQRHSELREQTLELATQALDARDPYTESHSARVAALAARLSEGLGRSVRETEETRTAGNLHDIGKIGIRDHILNKSERLTPDEWAEMQRHPDIGADMIARHSALAPLVPLVRHHHERWNGAGYPAGLSGEQIPLGARILAVADSFDTITSPRIYRPTRLSELGAVEDISQRAGAWYDPTVVDCLRSLYGLPPLHTLPQVTPPPATLWAALRQGGPLRTFLWSIAVSSAGDPLSVVATLTLLFAATRDPRVVAFAYVVQAVATLLVTFGIGSIVDRYDRRILLIGADLARAGVLVLVPLFVNRTVWILLPAAAVLACATAVAQPARLAAIPSFPTSLSATRVTAAVTASTMIGASLGFPLAGLLVLLFKSPLWLYPVDAITFLVSALALASLPTLGGRAQPASFVTVWRQSLQLPGAVRQFAIVAVAGWLIAMTWPILLPIAYHQSANGPAAFSLLEFALTIGVIIGTILVARPQHVSPLRASALGLILSGVVSVGVAISPWLPLTALVLLVASIGNPIYTVSSTTAILALGSRATHGALMSARFGIGQISLMIGAFSGGMLAAAIGPQVTFGMVGAGLAVVGMYVLWGSGRDQVRAAAGSFVDADRSAEAQKGAERA